MEKNIQQTTKIVLIALGLIIFAVGFYYKSLFGLFGVLPIIVAFVGLSKMTGMVSGGKNNEVKSADVGDITGPEVPSVTDAKEASADSSSMEIKEEEVENQVVEDVKDVDIDATQGESAEVAEEEKKD